MRLPFKLSGILLFAALGAGCVSPQISSEEKSFLYRIAENIREATPYFEPLKGFDDKAALQSGNSFSHMYQKNAGTPLIMNSGIYWFKVSLSQKPVDAFDSPQPIYTAEIPAFKKYLKLRVRGSNDELTSALLKIIRKNALEAGGVNERVDLYNAREVLPMAGRGMRRRF